MATTAAYISSLKPTMSLEHFTPNGTECHCLIMRAVDARVEGRPGKTITTTCGYRFTDQGAVTEIVGLVGDADMFAPVRFL